MRKWLRVPAVGLAVAAALWPAACSKQAELPDQDVEILIENGWSAYRIGEFQDAAKAFEAVRLVAEEGSREWAMGTYGLGITWDLKRPGENPKLATQLFTELLKKAPEDDMIPWTELALARQLHLVPVGQEPDYDAVNKAYRHIVETYPGHLAAKEAFLYLESIQLSLLEPATSKASADRLLKFIEENKDNLEFVGPAYSLLSVAYVTLDDQESRLFVEEQAFEFTETDPTDPSVEFAWAYWNLGTIAEFEVGDFELARSYYRRLIEEYPNDIRVHGSKSALKRMDALEAKLRAELAAGEERP